MPVEIKKETSESYDQLMANLRKSGWKPVDMSQYKKIEMKPLQQEIFFTLVNADRKLSLSELRKDLDASNTFIIPALHELELKGLIEKEKIQRGFISNKLSRFRADAENYSYSLSTAGKEFNSRLHTSATGELYEHVK